MCIYVSEPSVICYCLQLSSMRATPALPTSHPPHHPLPNSAAHHKPTVHKILPYSLFLPHPKTHSPLYSDSNYSTTVLEIETSEQRGKVVGDIGSEAGLTVEGFIHSVFDGEKSVYGAGGLHIVDQRGPQEVEGVVVGAGKEEAGCGEGWEEGEDGWEVHGG